MTADGSPIDVVGDPLRCGSAEIGELCRFRGVVLAGAPGRDHDRADPQRNKPDRDGVLAEVLEWLTVHPVADVREVLRLALEPAVAAAELAA